MSKNGQPVKFDIDVCWGLKHNLKNMKTMKTRLLVLLGLFSLVPCFVSPISAGKSGNQDPLGVPVPESFSTLWLALPAVGLFALARLRPKKDRR
jgi:hypothetical protein